VSDNGEPGRNDTFAIRLSNGYHASGSLSGGNIQLHKARDGECDEHGREHHGDADDDDEDGHDRHDD
jgi:hypothetical protein